MKKLIRNTLVAFFSLAAGTYALYAATPMVELPPMPNNEEFEQLEDIEELYYAKILDYFEIGAMYEAQIKFAGEKPKVTLAVPTKDDLESTEIEVLQKYYSIANKLKKQVLNLPEGEGAVKIKELQEQLRKLQNERNELADEGFRSSLEAENTDFYRNRYEELVRQIEELRLEVDARSDAYNRTLVNAYKTYQKLDNQLYPVFALSIFGTQYDFGVDNLNERFSPGVALNFTPGKFFGFGRFLSIWADYSHITNEIKLNREREITTATNRFSLGLLLNVYLDKVLNLENIEPHLSLGLGYFHANQTVSNTEITDYSTYGNLIKIEAGVRNFSSYFPFEIYADVNFNKYNKQLYLLGNSEIDKGKPWITNFSVGIRLPLWQKLKELP